MNRHTKITPAHACTHRDKEQKGKYAHIEDEFRQQYLEAAPERTVLASMDFGSMVLPQLADITAL
jgi:hypothetical protein